MFGVLFSTLVGLETTVGRCDDLSTTAPLVHRVGRGDPKKFGLLRSATVIDQGLIDPGPRVVI